MEQTLEKSLDSFMSVTAQSKVAIIVPLFGYWKDMASQQLDKNTLKLVLDRIYSSAHQAYVIFVADKRVPDEVANLLVIRAQGLNTQGVMVDVGASYGDYIRAGMKLALEKDAQYIVNINPWILLQHNAIDILVDRVNRNDAKIVSGYDLRGSIEPVDFVTTSFQIPKEERDLSLDCCAMKRYAAELIGIDSHYKTHLFLARDMWQSMYTQGFDVITSQRVPIYSLDVDWSEMESEADFEADKAYFIGKWKFDPSIVYVKGNSKKE
jgi:hypothetical protein